MSRVALSLVSLSLEEDLLITASLHSGPPSVDDAAAAAAIEPGTRLDPKDSYVGLDAIDGKGEEDAGEQP